jgi:hypothetical protein
MQVLVVLAAPPGPCIFNVNAPGGDCEFELGTCGFDCIRGLELVPVFESKIDSTATQECRRCRCPFHFRNRGN